MSAPTIAAIQIQKAVAEHFGTRLFDMTSRWRAREVLWSRYVAIYLTRELTSLSLPQIGRRFGGRDHTTIMHALAKMEALRDRPEIGVAINSVRERIADRRSVGNPP